MKKFPLLIALVSLSILSQPLPKMEETEFKYPLNSTHTEYSPVISPDGKYIVFQSDRQGGKGGMDIWISENKNYRNRTEIPEWSLPYNLTELNTPSFEGMFTIRFDKNKSPVEIFFTSVRNTAFGREGFSGLNIYQTRKNEATGKWSSPLHLNKINSAFNDRMPAVSIDGNTLVFSSDRPGGFGGYDLWVSKRDERTGLWSEPALLDENINTAENEISPYFHYDSQTLFFSSNSGNDTLSYRIYASQIQDMATNKFAAKFSLGHPFNQEADNEGISLTHDGLWAYYSSNRSSAMGDFDIYRSQLPEDLRNSYDFLLKGLVLDGKEEQKMGLDATIKIYDETIPLHVFTSAKNNNLAKEQSNFERKIKTGKFYKVEISSPGYHPNRFDLDLRGNISANSSRFVTITLQPLDNNKEAWVQPYAVVKDYTSREIIPDATVTQFSDSSREGVLLQKNDNKYLLQLPRENDFELFAKAKGYRDETLTLKKDALQTGQPVTLLLRKSVSYNQILDEKIFFEFNKIQLTDEYLPYLNKLAEYLKKSGDTIEIGGHTDNVGSLNFNLKLSKKRAKIISAYLRKKGVKKEQLKTKAYWYSKPLQSNEEEKGRAKNRRVDFKLL